MLWYHLWCQLQVKLIHLSLVSCSAGELFECLIRMTAWPSSIITASTVSSLASKPTLPVLLKFKTSSGSTVNIVEQIGTHYSTLGPLLLNDDTGALISAITNQHHHNAVAINQEILTQWLQGRGKLPVTWCTLVDVLRDVGLSELTEMIQKDLNISVKSLAQTSGETVTGCTCIYCKCTVALLLLQSSHQSLLCFLNRD